MDNLPPGAGEEIDHERRRLLAGLAMAWAGLPLLSDPAEAARPVDDAWLRDAIRTVVVIHAENRSFNNLFHDFPGLQRPLAGLKPADYVQLDRDGKAPLKALPRSGAAWSRKARRCRASATTRTKKPSPACPTSLSR